MTKYVKVRLTVPQAEALNQAAAEVQAGEGDGWSDTRWGVLSRARDALISAMDRKTRKRGKSA
jgi:hypothetical protein